MREFSHSRRSARAFPVLVLALVAGLSAATAAEIPAVAGWTATGETVALPSGELWRHINGAAELFESHGVRELTVRNLEKEGLLVSVSLYEMSSSLGAYGVFEVERSDGGTEVPAGTAAVLYAPYQALMLKDHFYVKAEAQSGDLDPAAARSLLSALATALPGSGKLPEELGLPPEGGRIDGTLGYTAEGFLGLSELRRCVHAEYAFGEDGRGTVFVVLPGDGQDVDGLWDTLPEAWSVAGEGGRAKVREIPYRGPVAVMKTRSGLLGAIGAESPEQLLAWLHGLP